MSKYFLIAGQGKRTTYHLLVALAVFILVGSLVWVKFNVRHTDPATAPTTVTHDPWLTSDPVPIPFGQRYHVDLIKLVENFGDKITTFSSTDSNSARDELLADTMIIAEPVRLEMLLPIDSP
jgi:hypothetical protein